ncbi:MAG: ribosome-associated translation inhibitor RaiA [Alphaproteobacteria bacterium]|nr:ribosome-associated translation inhibitor RaiA [Alphaproteobacteria bacterium]
MQIQISGQQIDIGDALRVHVTDKLNAGVGKFFDHSLDAAVVFSREGEGYGCTASVHVFRGLTLRAEGRGQDIYASFDQAAERIEKRLRRYKERLKTHKGKGAATDDMEARDVVIRAEPEEHDSPVNGEPTVIAESVSAISTLRVGDAVMRLDISGAPVVVFRNAGHGALNVVYRRPDGHIGWIDPSFDPKP